MTEYRLYVTWRHPEGLISPVGLLTRRASATGEAYSFSYLKIAENLDGFSPLPGLPDLHRIYEEDELFPVFRKRQMPRQRSDYPEYVEALGLTTESDPFEVMARNEGRKMTDRIEVFAPPSRADDGRLTTLFFVRGIRHLDGAGNAVSELKPGDKLLMKDDPSNQVNSRAILINTRNQARVGWVPDYLVDTIHELRDFTGSDSIQITAEHVNHPTVAPYMRLICRLNAPWPDGYEPLSGPEFQPIVS